MLGTSSDIWKCIPKADKSSIWLRWIYFHFLCENVGIIVCKYENAWCSDVNEVMHTGRPRAYIMAVGSGGCCFTRYIESLTEAGRQSPLVFVSPTMIKGLATAYELASMKRADLTGGQTFSNALHEGFWLPVPAGFLVSICSAKCPSSSVCHLGHHVLNLNSTS